MNMNNNYNELKEQVNFPIISESLYRDGNLDSSFFEMLKIKYIYDRIDRRK